MSFLTYLSEAEVRDTRRTVIGKVYTRPALIYTDGFNVTYACDVDIGQEGSINDNGDIGIIPLRNVPIASNNMELSYAEVGQAVTLTKNDAGHWEVTGLSKTYPGEFTLVGVVITQPCHTFPFVEPGERRTLVLDSDGPGDSGGPGGPGSPGGTVPGTIVVVGDPESIGRDVRLLTYGELFSEGVYGLVPYGAVGVFQNGELIEIRSN